MQQHICIDCLRGTLKGSCGRCSAVRCCRCLDAYFEEEKRGLPVCPCGYQFERSWLLKNFGERYVQAKAEERVVSLVQVTQEALVLAAQDVEWANGVLTKHLPDLDKLLVKEAKAGGDPDSLKEVAQVLGWKWAEIDDFLQGKLLFRPQMCYLSRRGEGKYELVQHREYEKWDLEGVWREPEKQVCPACRVRAEINASTFFCGECGTVSRDGIQIASNLSPGMKYQFEAGRRDLLFVERVAVDKNWKQKQVKAAQGRLSAKVLSAAIQFMGDRMGMEERRKLLKRAEHEYQFDLEVIRLVRKWQKDVEPFFQIPSDDKRWGVAHRIIQEKSKEAGRVFEETRIAYFN